MTTTGRRPGFSKATTILASAPAAAPEPVPTSGSTQRRAAVTARDVGTSEPHCGGGLPGVPDSWRPTTMPDPARAFTSAA